MSMFRDIPIEDRDGNKVGHVSTAGASHWPGPPPTFMQWMRGYEWIHDTKDSSPKAKLILTTNSFATKEEATRLDGDVSLWDRFEEKRLATISKYGTITDSYDRKIGEVSSNGTVTNASGTLVGRIRDGDAITQAAGAAALLTILIEKEEPVSYRSAGSDGCVVLILIALLGVFGLIRFRSILTAGGTDHQGATGYFFKKTK